MGIWQRAILGFVSSVVRWPRATLGLAVLLVGLCTLGALTRLEISSNQNKLFSPKAQFFQEYLDFIEKFPENEAIYVLVEAKGSEADIPVARWTAAADAITERVRQLQRSGGEHAAVRSVDSRVPAAEMGEMGLSFDSAANVRRAREQVEPFMQLVRLWGEKPGLGEGLLGSTPMARFLSGLALAPADADTARFTGLLAGSWTETLKAGQVDRPDLGSLDASDPSRLGYYYLPDETDRSRNVLLVRVYPQIKYSTLTAVSDAVDAIRGAVKEAAAGFPEFKVGLTGRPALEADEMRTTDHDSKVSEILALTAVFIGLVIMLRSVWLAIVAELALAVGIGWTFGWATVAIGELNLLSIVFLIALIGIGMDYLVQVMSRYLDERGKSDDPQVIWAEVFRHVGPPINTACAGAAGAFLVSMASDFRGAAELGVIAGGGLLLCLLSAYVVVPALLTIWPGKRRVAAVRVSPVVVGASGRWWVGPVVWGVAIAAAVPFMLRAKFDPGLIELQAQGLESVGLVRKLQTWSAVVMSKDLEVLREAQRRLAGVETIARTESILDAEDNAAWLRARSLPAVAWAEPGAVKAGDVGGLASRAESLAVRWEEAVGRDSGMAGRGELVAAAGRLREFAGVLRAGKAEVVAGVLSAWQTAFVGDLRGTLATFNPGPIDATKLPASLRDHFISVDGTYALYIHPRHDLWERPALNKFVGDVETHLAGLKGGTVSGIAINLHHSTESIEASFYRSAGLALGLIVVLVFLDLRRVGLTLAAISVLALGLPMLVGVMGLCGVSWNFANFFGLPILIGAGHEYGVFMVHRFTEAKRDPKRAWIGWDVADKALLMCAYVTSVSFGFFWLIARHEGLKSLGFVMAAGTVCIYLATILVVRPVLKWRLSQSPGADVERVI